MADKIIWDDEKPDAGIVWDDEKPQPSRAIPEASPVGKRLAEGFLDPIYGVAQIADKAINPIRQLVAPGAASMEDVIRERDANYQAPEGFDVARMVGNVANPVSWAGGGVPGLTRAGAAAAHGALQAGLAPVSPDGNFAEQKVEQAGMGAVAGRVLSKALAGLTPTKEAAALMDRGVQPTVGQSLGGMANTFEQKLTSVPFVGDAITYARNRAQKEFEAAVLQRAVDTNPPTPDRFGIVPRATKGAPRTLDEANAIASQKFNAVVPHLTQDIGTWADPQIVAAKAASNPEMTDQNLKILNGVVTDWFDPAKLSRLDAEGLKKLDSQLGFLVRKYAGGSPADKTLADELRNVQAAYRDNLNRLLPEDMRGYSMFPPKGEEFHGPVKKGALDEANTAWAKLVPINKAASRRADERITPRALQRAMASQARQDVSRMPVDNLVDNAVAVLPSTIPDSGTAGRAMLGGGALVGGGTLGVLPQMLGAGAVAGLGATRPVQRAIMGNTAWQRTLGPMDGGLTAAIAAALRGQITRKNSNE